VDRSDWAVAGYMQSRPQQKNRVCFIKKVKVKKVNLKVTATQRVANQLCSFSFAELEGGSS